MEKYKLQIIYNKNKFNKKKKDFNNKNTKTSKYIRI